MKKKAFRISSFFSLFSNKRSKKERSKPKPSQFTLLNSQILGLHDLWPWQEASFIGGGEKEKKKEKRREWRKKWDCPDHSSTNLYKIKKNILLKWKKNK